MVIENHSAAASVFRTKHGHASAFSALFGLDIVDVVRVMTETLEVCGSVDGDVLKQFAFATFFSAVDFSRFDVVEKVVFVAMPAKTLGAGAYHFAIHSFSVSP